MQITVLVIVYHGTEHISLHEDETQAWSQLVAFMDQKIGLTLAPLVRAPAEERHAVARFFSDPDDVYIIAQADASEIAAAIDAAIHAIPAQPPSKPTI